jgi:site-specific DNA-methyltransferase (adenine-specific)
MACAIEDAGFEIRDSLHWVYGSGFPKSLDVSKAIDKTNGEPDRLHKFTAWMRTTGMTARQLDELTDTNMGGHYLTAKSQPAIPTAAIWQVIRPHIAEVPDWVDDLVARIEAEREVVGKAKGTHPVNHINASNFAQGAQGRVQLDITTAATDAAKQWEGWGTALKPAHEPIVLARRPLIGTVAANVLTHGTGALNIDGARVEGQGAMKWASPRGGIWTTDSSATADLVQNEAGRWPANVIFDTETGALLDRQEYGASRFFTSIKWDKYTDTGIDAPFRYVPKPSKQERNAGLDGLPERDVHRFGAGIGEGLDPRAPSVDTNHHPTVKPLALMRWLVRLVTPPGGTVLEPFAGSGTTLMACVLEGFNGIGIEMTDEYLPIIEGRVRWAQHQPPRLFL